MLLVVALVHVDVMNTVARSELEVFILLALRAPLGAEGINDGALLANSGDDGVFHSVLQVVVRPRKVAGHHLELVDFDDAAADKILCDAAGLAGQLSEAGWKRGELLRQRGRK